LNVIIALNYSQHHYLIVNVGLTSVLDTNMDVIIKQISLRSTEGTCVQRNTKKWR